MRKGFGLLVLPLLLLSSVHAQSSKVTYVYTDPQGTPLAEADSDGNIITTFDYKPYGSQVLGSPSSSLGYTGHVNDPDTGLVYMQHRYYDPTIGRFISRDAMPPKPGNLDYINRYAYVGDNPVIRTDPFGDYICNGSDRQCGSVKQALGDVQKAESHYAQGSQGQKLLAAVLQFYGKEGEKNGVNVGFGNANNNNAITETKGKETDITFNLANVHDTGRNAGTTPRVELAAAVAHEGQHGIDGQFFGRSVHRAQWRQAEYKAFTTQSYINEAFNKTSPYSLWEHGWKENSTSDWLRDSAANFNADWTVYGNGASH